MARVTSEGLNGVVGNIIFYIRDGRQYARSMPAPRNKRKNQPASAGTTSFGIVSRFGSEMLVNLSNNLLFKFTLNTYNSARGWMRNQYVANQNAAWPLLAKGSSMCQLNTAIDLRDFLTVDIAVKDNGGGQVEVTVGEINPIRNIKAPTRTTEVKIKVLAVTSAFEPKGSEAVKTGKDEFSFSFINKLLPPKSLVLNTRAKTNDMVLVVIAVEYNINGLWVSDLQYLPAAIVAMGRME
jgi:hypothetical protein